MQVLLVESGTGAATIAATPAPVGCVRCRLGSWIDSDVQDRMTAAALQVSPPKQPQMFLEVRDFPAERAEGNITTTKRKRKKVPTPSVGLEAEEQQFGKDV